MATNNKSEFSISIMLVIALLAAIAVIYLFIFSMAEDGYGKNMARINQQGDEAIAARIKPMVTLDDLLGDAPAEPIAVVAQVKSGKDLFDGACGACHATGAAGAPKLGDNAAWGPRAEQGVDGLLASAKAGKGAMPPKGGSSYSDAEIQLVIEYMLTEAGLMEASPAPAAADSATTAAEDDMQNQASVMDVAPDAPAHDLAAGEANYQTACFACHGTGAAGAPKLGDHAAWADRVARGFDDLVNSALHGKGAMPPKGGNASLSDEDIKNIVAFMMEKAK